MQFYLPKKQKNMKNQNQLEKIIQHQEAKRKEPIIYKSVRSPQAPFSTEEITEIKRLINYASYTKLAFVILEYFNVGSMTQQEYINNAKEAYNIYAPRSFGKETLEDVHILWGLNNFLKRKYKY